MLAFSSRMEIGVIIAVTLALACQGDPCLALEERTSADTAHASVIATVMEVSSFVAGFFVLLIAAWFLKGKE